MLELEFCYAAGINTDTLSQRKLHALSQNVKMYSDTTIPFTFSQPHTIICFYKTSLDHKIYLKFYCLFVVDSLLLLLTFSSVSAFLSKILTPPNTLAERMDHSDLTCIDSSVNHIFQLSFSIFEQFYAVIQFITGRT